MSDDRQHVHPLALAVLDAKTPQLLLDASQAHDMGGTPLLIPRTSAVMAAVSEYGFEMCVGYKDDGGTLLPYPDCTKHGPCKIKTICRAWRKP